MLNYKLLMDNELIIQNSQLIIKKVGEFIRYMFSKHFVNSLNERERLCHE